MALAQAILRAYGLRGPLIASLPLLARRRVLEVNIAGELDRYLRMLPRSVLAEYPSVNLEDLPYPDQHFDLIVHSDTLEHVSDPVRGLTECYRTLKRGGALAYTIPVASGRLTASREGKAPSYHGSLDDADYLVHTEYGADFWVHAFAAGFRDVRLIFQGCPEALAVAAVRH